MKMTLESEFFEFENLQNHKTASLCNFMSNINFDGNQKLHPKERLDLVKSCKCMWNSFSLSTVHECGC